MEVVAPKDVDVHKNARKPPLKNLQKTPLNPPP